MQAPRFTALVLCLGLLFAAPPAPAEEGEEEVDLLELSLEELGEVEIITVTARKREESMQETPVAVTAFSGRSLDDRGVKTIEELEKFVPNMTFEDGAFHGASIYIRGVGQRDSRQFLEPGVGVYVDGVYVARQSAILPVVDVERIEVLRGPQGTLYGRNTIGGAVNYVSKKPGPDFEVSADLGFGNFGLVDSRGSFNVPLVDDLLFSRVAFAARSREGYTSNVVDGSHWDDDNLVAVAPSFRLAPMDELTFDLSGHYTRQNLQQRAAKCFITDPGNPTVAALALANGLFGSDNPDYHAACARDEDSGFYDFSASTNGNYELETWGVAGTFNLDPGGLWIFDDNNFKSITAWNVQSEWDQHNDLDATDAVIIDRTFYSPQDISTISEELTWTSTTTLGDLLPFLPESVGSGAVYPTLGAFFAWEESDHGTQDNVALGGGNPLIVPMLPGPVPFDITESASKTIFDQPKIDNESRAVYTQWTFEPHQYFHVTGGVRYTWEEKSLERFEPMEQGKRTDSFSKWTPMASATLIAPDSWLDAVRGDSAILYYTYAEGFKSGGFNEVTDVSTGDPIPAFDEEELTSHEVGTKLGFFDNRVLLNSAFFYNEYEDLQLTVIRTSGFGEIGASITNAGEATIKGFEVELVTEPIRALQLSGSVGYLDAEYDEFLDQVPGMPGMVQDRSDEPFFNVPEWSVNAGIQYGFDLGNLVGGRDLGTLTPRWDYSYKSKRAFHLTRAGFEAPGEPFTEGPTNLHHFRLGWESPGLRYGTSFWIHNVFDEEYINGAVDLTDFFGTGSTRVGAPRTFGVELTLHYF